MRLNNQVGFFQVILTLVFTMCLRVVPLSEEMALLNPDWVLLVLIYWVLSLPDRVGIFYAWTFGLLTDELTGRLLGQYALAYSLIVYLCLKFHNRLRQFPFFQQGLFIFFCLLLSQLLLFFTKNLQHPAQLHASFWLPVFTGTLCWPFVYSLMRFISFFRFIK